MCNELVFINNTAAVSYIDSLSNLASKNGIANISVPTGFLSFIEHDNLSAMIDFPLGINPTSLRKTEIEYAINNGATRIELVINPSLLSSRDTEKIYYDYMECRGLCLKNSVKCIPIIEHRFANEQIILEIAKILESSGAESLILGTGTVIENVIDLFMVCKKLIENSSLSIHTGYGCMDDNTKEHFLKSGVSTIREYSTIKFIDNLKM